MYDDMALGYDVTAVALGMDALERSVQKGSGALDTEGLVPIYIGGDAIVPRNYSNWEMVEDELDSLSQRIEDCPILSRRQFLEALVRSLRSAIKVFRGDETSFSYRLQNLVGVPASPADEEVIAQLHEEIDGALARRNFIRGSLAQRIDAWQHSNFIPVDKLENTIYCRRRRCKELPKGCSMSAIFEWPWY